MGLGLLLLSASSLGQQVPLTALEEAILVASEPQTGAEFAQYIAIGGDVAAVGALGDDNKGGINAGAAYVYARTGTRWTEQVKLTAPDAQPGDQFGRAVAVFNDTIVIGAVDAGAADAGAAYVFVWTGTEWMQQARLEPSDGETGDNFGSAVAIDGDTIVVGAFFSHTSGFADAGAAYVFTRNGSAWTEQVTLFPADVGAGDHFGDSLALVGNTLLVGSVDPPLSAVYEFTGEGASWSEESKLVPPDAPIAASFGRSLAIAGDTIISGAAGHTAGVGADSGAAYVFVRAGTGWDLEALLVSPDPVPGELFGGAVAVVGDLAWVSESRDSNGGGLDAGAVHVFSRTAGSWSPYAKIVASDPAPLDRFGHRIALSGDTLLAGAIWDDVVAGDNAGSVAVLRLVPIGTWLDLGQGLAGSSGMPSLDGSGELLPSTVVSLNLANGRAFSTSTLVVGVSNIIAPFKGGVIVPHPDLLFAQTTDFFGKASFGGLWPAGIPSGFTIYFQYWIVDAAGPQGFAASNAVSGTTP
jgi:hypothetical protein